MKTFEELREQDRLEMLEESRLLRKGAAHVVCCKGSR